MNKRLKLSLIIPFYNEKDSVHHFYMVTLSNIRGADITKSTTTMKTSQIE